MSDIKRDESELGALWAKTGSKGPYLTGEIAGQKVICFPVDSSNPKAPAWRVKKQQPQGETQQPKGENVGGGFTKIDETDIGF